MKKSAIKTFARQYAELRPLYAAFASKLEDLLGAILESQEIKFQIIEARAKEVDSFAEKMARPGKNYSNPLSQVPDLIGARIIVYYVDDVERVADVIKSEFKVVEEETSHQLDSFDADRFGYLSVHLVLQLSASRVKLTEWKPFSSLHFEVQIRTVIQHAWSAVSHALQYKRESSVPTLLRRRLFRIAGLFELADEEFTGIRDEKRRLEAAASEAIARGDKDIPLTPTGVEQFIAQWTKMSSFVERARTAGFDVAPGIDPQDPYVGYIADFAQKVGISSVCELKEALEKSNSDVFQKMIDVRGTGSWLSNEDFLVYVLLIAAFKDQVDLANQEGAWAPEVFEELRTALENL